MLKSRLKFRCSMWTIFMISAACISFQILVRVQLVYFASGSQQNIYNRQNALSMITPPIITSVRPLNSTSFTVNWEPTGLDDNYIVLVTWTNLRTGLKEGSVTVSNNTNSYTVKGLSGIDNYNVSVAVNISHGMMMSDPITVYGEIHPNVELKITQSMIWAPLVDGIKMRLTCVALVKTKFDTISFATIIWTGLRLRKSLWIRQSPVITVKNESRVERSIGFIPWLQSDDGEYICHLVIKDKNKGIFIMNKAMEVKGEYRGLINSRTKSQKFNARPIVPSKWFPNANLCGPNEVWQKYAEFHASVLSGKHKGKYLIYDCTGNSSNICGGFGNRIQSITLLLTLAMLTKHVFLIQVDHPTDINDYLLPNAIQWNHTVPNGLKTRFIHLLHPKSRKEIQNALFHPDKQDIIRVKTFLGLFYLIQGATEATVEKMTSTFHLKTHYDCILLYGCAFNYLFKYQPIVHHRIESLQNEYRLEAKKFVTLHVRTHIHDGKLFNPLHLKFPFKPMFDCAVMAAKSLSYKLNLSKVPIFLASDRPEITGFAKENYKDMFVFSKAPHFHIDLTKYEGAKASKQYDDGTVGILSDIEIGSRAAVLIRSKDSSFSETMGVVHFLNPQNNLHPFDFYENLIPCQL